MEDVRQSQPSWLAPARIACSLLFLGSGTLHFTRPRPFTRIVPDALPNPELLVALSGVAELAGGAALFVPQLRRPAAFGLAVLLVAVFPANVNMAVNSTELAPGIPPWLLWARLPLQPLLIWLVLRASRR
ncbi:MAG: hypothetical protein JWL76_2068 [Thermoleophilia bacterium]|nr:hypothetical protein [Thermoleophilia bacterium]